MWFFVVATICRKYIKMQQKDKYNNKMNPVTILDQISDAVPIKVYK